MVQCTMQYNFQRAFPTICYISFVDLFYIPSFLRGEGDNRMAVLEPRRSVGWPRGSQGEGMNVLTHRSKEQHVNHISGPDHHLMITIRECMQHTRLHPACSLWTPFSQIWDLEGRRFFLACSVSAGFRSDNADKWDLPAFSAADEPEREI